MTLDEYSDAILRRLGSPFVDVEIQQAGSQNSESGVVDMVPLLITDAFNELKAYIDEVFYITVPASSTAIDLSPYNVRTVSSVMRGNINAITSPQNVDGMLFSPIAYFSSQSASMGLDPYNMNGFVQDYAATLQYRQLRNQISQDMDYTYDYANKMLYVYQQVPTSAYLTIQCTKEYQDISEIQDPFWVNWMMRLGLAYVKEGLGRARSKYKMTSAPYELDGEELLSEARDELREIREFLESNNEMFLPVD